MTAAADSYEAASQWRLMRWKFRKHKLAMIAVPVLLLLYLTAAFCDFLTPTVPAARLADYKNAPPQQIRFVDPETGFSMRPFVYGLKQEMDRNTFRRTFADDTTRKHPIRFFVQGEPYKLLGLFPANVHLFGLEDPNAPLLLMGSDSLGRDLFTRILYGARISLSFGLLGIALTLVLGLVIGGISGYMGGAVDTFIQRVIDLLVCIPTIPLWMALAAALPRSWTPLETYFGMILIFSVIDWTGLARVVRGKVLSLREEDFTLAAKLGGASDMRIIMKHLLPSFSSYIIVSTSMAIPSTILGETALSFLGIGLQPPVVSWGVLLQDAQNLQTLAHQPWLLWPAAFVIVTVLMFNFLGDGLRDAADPYNKEGGGRMERNEEVILELNDLRAHFRVKEGVLKAVDGIGFAIKRRRTLGIVGESGCGKSVTSQAILRLLPSFATVGGEMLLRRTKDGRAETVDIAKLDPNGEEMRSIRGGEIAIIFQEPMKAFSPIHTIGDQITEAILLHRTKDRKEAMRIAIETLKKVGMSNPEQRLNEYPHQLSGGMRQRAMIAMAVAGNPAVLIADEPTTALDVTVQAQVLRLINELKESNGTSVVFITHDLGVIAEMSDEVAVMYLGKVVEYTDVDTLFYGALHPYTQALLASIPSISRKHARLETIEGTVPFPVDLPEGCGFYNRCPKARPGVCNVGDVPLYEVEPGHQVRCVLAEPGKGAN